MTVNGTRDRRNVRLVTLCALALLVGAVTGLGAIALRALIGLLHNLFFLGQFAWHYDANEPTPASPFGAFVILARLIGQEREGHYFDMESPVDRQRLKTPNSHSAPCRDWSLSMKFNLSPSSSAFCGCWRTVRARLPAI